MEALQEADTFAARFNALFEKIKNKCPNCKYENTDPFLRKKHEVWLCRSSFPFECCYKEINNESRFNHKCSQHQICVPEIVGNLHFMESKGLYLNSKNTKLFCIGREIFQSTVTFIQNVISITLVHFIDDYSGKFYDVSYKITIPEATSDNFRNNYIQGKLLPMNADWIKGNGEYWYIADWRKDIFLDHTDFNEIIINNQRASDFLYDFELIISPLESTKY